MDQLVNGLSIQDRQIILAKMRYNLSIKSFCQVFEISSTRTAFRRIQSALEHFTLRANSSPYREKLEYLLDNENFIIAMRKHQTQEAYAY